MPFSEVDYTTQFSDFVHAQSYDEQLKNCINSAIKVESVSDNGSTFECVWSVPDVDACKSALVADTGLQTELTHSDDVKKILESAMCAYIASGSGVVSETVTPLYVNNNWDYSQQLNDVYSRFTTALDEMVKRAEAGTFSELETVEVMKQQKADSAFVYTEFKKKYLVSNLCIYHGEDAVKQINNLSSLNNAVGSDYVFISYDVTALSPGEGLACNHFVLGDADEGVSYSSGDSIVGLTQKLECKKGQTVTLTVALRGPKEAKLYFTSKNISNNVQVVE